MKHMLVELKQDINYVWLKEVDSMSLTNTLENLDTAYTNYFEKRGNKPIFKKRGVRESYTTDCIRNTYKNNNYSTDLDKFISDNYSTIYTPEEIELWKNRFYLTAYLQQLQGKLDSAQKFYSICDNYSFLTNILRKSIYEYYVLQKWNVKNAANTTNMFKKHELLQSEFELMQLDMIISTIETKWVG